MVKNMSPIGRKYRNIKEQVSAKKHIFATSIIVIMMVAVAFTTIFVVFNGTTVTADIENLTTWTVDNVNVSGIWYINSTRVNWSDAQNINECYVYKDLGAGNIGDFNYSFDLHIESAENGASPSNFAVADVYVAKGMSEFKDVIGVFFDVNGAGDSKKIFIRDYSYMNTSSTPYNMEPPFTKYMVLGRTGNVATLWAYNDSARTDLNFTLQVFCNANTSRYVYAFQPFDHASDTSAYTGYRANIDLDYGGSDASIFSLKGVSTPYNLTFSGATGATVHCNSSGDANEWAEINMTINATDNMTELRIWMDDLNDTGAYINASNMTLYISSDNATYGYLGTFPDGGGNCTNHINTTNWVDVTMGANPFNGTGLHDKTASIYFVIKLTIPAGLGTDIFYTGAIDSCKIYIGHKA